MADESSGEQRHYYINWTKSAGTTREGGEREATQRGRKGSREEVGRSSKGSQDRAGKSGAGATEVHFDRGALSDKNSSLPN